MATSILIVSHPIIISRLRGATEKTEAALTNPRALRINPSALPCRPHSTKRPFRAERRGLGRN